MPIHAHARAPWPHVEATALLAASPPEEVLAILDRALYAPRQMLVDRQRLRVLARLDPDARRYKMLRETYRADVQVSVHGLLDLADAALWEGDVESASRDLEHIEAIAPHHPEAIYLRALMLALRQEDRALAALTKEHEAFDAKAPAFLLDVAALALRFDRRAIACASLSKLSTARSPEGAWFDRMGELMLSCDHEAMRKIAKSLLAQHANEDIATARLRTWMAILSGARQGEEGAYMWLERALDVERGPLASVWLEKGRYHAAREQTEIARDSFKKALRYDSSLADAHLELAESLARSQQHEQARDVWIRYLELRPYGSRSDRVRARLDALHDPQGTPAQTE